MAEDTLIPPAWDDVEKDEGYAKLSPLEKAETLSNWAKYTREYGDQNGWWNNPETQDQFSTTTQEKLAEIRAQEAPITGATAGLYGDNPIAQTAGTIFDRISLGLAEFAPRAMATANQAASLATRVGEPISAAIDATFGTDQQKRYQENNVLGRELAESAQQLTAQAQEYSEAGRAIGGGPDIPLIGRPGDILQQAVPTTMQAVMDIAFSGGGGTAKTLMQPARTGLEYIIQNATQPAMKRVAAMAGTQQGLSTLNQEMAQRMQDGETLFDAQGNAIPESALAGLTTAVFTSLGGMTGAESVLKESGVTGLKNRIFTTLKEGAFQEAPEEMADQAANQIASFVSEEFDSSVPKEGTTMAQRFAAKINTKELVQAGVLGGIVGSGITGVGQVTESITTPTPSQVKQAAIIDTTAEQAETLRASDAPLTADAVEQKGVEAVVQTQLQSDAETADFLAEAQAEDPTLFVDELESTFAPPAQQEAIEPFAGIPITEETQIQEVPEVESLVLQETPQAPYIPTEQEASGPLNETQENRVNFNLIERVAQGLPISQSSQADLITKGFLTPDGQLTPQAQNYATQTISQQESPAIQYQEGDTGRQASETGSSNSVLGSEESPIQEEVTLENAEIPTTEQAPTLGNEERIATEGEQISDTITSDVQPIPTPEVEGRRRVLLGVTPQSFEVVEELPQTEVEKANGEKYFTVRNERTGETQVVEERDMRPIKAQTKLRKKASSLPANKRAKAERAIEYDQSPELYGGAPLTDQPAIGAENNSRLFDELDEIGVFDDNATGQTILENIASLQKAPQWAKTLATRLAKIGAQNVSVEVVNRPQSDWSALYVGPNTILINLAQPSPGAIETFLHEISHHVTIEKLRNPESLKGEEAKAYADLEAIFNQLKDRPNFQDLYPMSSVEEMVAGAFGDAGFRNLMESIPADGGETTLWRKFVQAIGRLLFNKTVTPTSLLERTVENAFTLAGAPITESPFTAASGQKGARFTMGGSWKNSASNPFSSPEAEAKAYTELTQNLEAQQEVPAEELTPLTPEQQALLSDPKAMDTVYFWANKFNNILGTTVSDRVDEGIQALVRAAQKFNPENAAGANFQTYASRSIKNALIDFRARKATEARRTRSIDAPLGEDGATFHDIEPSPEDLTVQKNDLQAMREMASDALTEVMEAASPRDRQVLLDYASGGVLRDVAAKNNMSAEGVRKVLLGYRNQVEQALLSRGITDIADILVEQESRFQAEPIQPIRPEDEQNINPEEVGILEAQDTQRTEPIYGNETEDERGDEELEAYSAIGSEGIIAADAIGAGQGFRAAADRSLSESELRAIQSFRDNVRLGGIGRSEAREAVAMQVVLNEPLSELKDAFESRMGKEIVFVGGLPKDAPSGMLVPETPNILYINRDGQFPLMFLTGHEFAHSMLETNPELYSDLKEYVLKNAKDWTAYKQDLQKLTYKPSEFEDEFVADFVGNHFNDRRFWRSLARKDQNLFTRLAQAASQYLSQLLGLESSMARNVEPYFNNWSEAREKLTQIVQQYQANPKVEAQDIRNAKSLTVAPLSPRGKKTRTPIFRPSSTPYKPEGLFSAAGKWNAEIYKLLQQKDQKTRTALSRLQFVDNQLQRNIKSEYGKGPIPVETINTALGNTDNRLTPAQAAAANAITDPVARAVFISDARQANLDAFKIRQRDAFNSLPYPIQESITEMRELIDGVSRQLQKDGGIAGDLKGAVDQNIGTYLHRSYRIFDGDEWQDFIRSNKPEAVAIRNKAENLFTGYVKAQKATEYARDMRAAGTPVTRKAALSHVAGLDVSEEVNLMLNDYLAVADGSVVDTIRGRLPGQKNQSIIKVRGDIPKEIRDLWGQQDDASVNFAKTYASIATFLENNKFLNSVLEDGLANGYLWKEGVSAGIRPAGYVEVVGSEGAKSMAPLAGVYGPPELRDAFQDYFNPIVQDWLGTLTTAAMKAKTVYSIGAIVRNFLGNPAFMLFNGNIFGSLGNSASLATANLRKLGTKEQRERVARYTELGILGDNVGPGVLKELSDRAKKIGDSGITFSDAIKYGDKKIKPIREAFEGVYSGVDDFWKIYAFESEVAKMKWANPGMSTDEAERKSAEIVRNTVPTYSESPAIVRDLLKNKAGKFIAPFITFTTEVIRVTGGAAKQTVTELRSSNPRERAIGAARLAGMMAVAALPGVLSNASKALFGYDDEDEEALRRGLPEWQKDATLIFLPRDEKGNVRYLDFSYLNPYNYFSDTVKAVQRAIKNGDSPDKAAKDAAMAAAYQLAGPFLKEQIAFGAFVDVARNSKANGSQIYNPQDTDAQKATKIAERLIQPFIPGTADSLNRIYKAGAGVVEPSGRAYDLTNEIMAPIVGQRISSYDMGQSLQNQASRFNGERNDASRLFTSILNSKGTINPGAVAEAYTRANQQSREVFNNLRKDYEAALELGLSKKDAVAILKAKRVGEETIKQVTSGTYRRYEPSDSTLNLTRKTNPERYREYIEVRKATPAREPFEE